MRNGHTLLALCIINTVMFSAVHAFAMPAAIARQNAARLATGLALSTKAKPPPHNTWTLHRIERILANRGIGSRSEVAAILQQGRCRVNGEVVRSSSARFPVSAVVEVDGIEIKPVPLIAIFNKPVGVECTMKQISKAKHQSLSLAMRDPMVLKVMHPVGRLDADSSGLLLFSSDGQLTRVLLNPSFQVPRGYEAVVEGCASYETTKEKLAAGVETSDGMFTADLLSAEPDEKTNTTRVQLVVTEGKYRMVRRMLHNIGHSVVSLHRISFGGIKLGDLPEGELRHASEVEAAWAEALLKKPTMHRRKAPRRASMGPKEGAKATVPPKRRSSTPNTKSSASGSSVSH